MKHYIRSKAHVRRTGPIPGNYPYKPSEQDILVAWNGAPLSSTPNTCVPTSSSGASTRVLNQRQEGLASSCIVDPTSTSTSSAPSTSSSAAATPAWYEIFTKEGTSIEQFDAMCNKIDGNAGLKRLYGLSANWQVYLTPMLPDQIQNVSTQFHDIIDGVIPERKAVAWSDDDDKTKGEPHNISTPESMSRFARLNDPPWVTRPGAPSHLKLLSAPLFLPIDTPNLHMPAYRYHENAGRGSTIYIIDSGCNIAHNDLQPRGRRVETLALSNQETLGSDWRNGQPVNPNSDEHGHGTAIASLAVGITLGVAPLADLVCIKTTGLLRDGTVANQQFFAGARSIDYVLQDVARKRAQPGGGAQTFVVNLSWAHPLDPATLQQPAGQFRIRECQRLQDLIRQCWQQGIVVVVAAGNRRTVDFVDLQCPTNMGAIDNPLITVGSVDDDGELGRNSWVRPGLGGSITVYAQGVDVWAAGNNPNRPDEVVGRTGTSVASPQVVSISTYSLLTEHMLT